MNHQHKQGRKQAEMIFISLLLSASFFGCQFSSVLGVDEQSGTGSLSDRTNAPADVIHIPSTSATESPTQSSGDESPIPTEAYSPQTGLRVPTAVSENRPIAVAIGNTSSSLPQYGLSEADILIEAPVEGGSTRLLCLTADYASVRCFGPIRSTRNYLQEVAGFFDAMTVFAGTSDVSGAISYETKDSLDYISQNLKETFYRDPARKSPHNLMTSGALTLFAIDDSGYRNKIKSAALPYRIALTSSAVTTRGESALRVELPFSSVQRTLYTYDAVTNTYLRYQNGSAHVDGYTQKQISYTNLLILFCDSATTKTADGAVQLTMQLNGQGTGFFACGGVATEVNWSVKNGQLTVTDKSGTPLSVSTGKTYLALFRSALMLSVCIE